MTAPQPYTATIISGNWIEAAEKLSQVWADVRQAAENYLAAYPHRAEHVDRLRIYVRPDSGNLFVAFASQIKPLLYGEVACIHLPMVEKEWHELPQDPAAEERAHVLLFQHLKHLVRSAAVLQSAQLAVTVVEFDDLETETTLS